MGKRLANVIRTVSKEGRLVPGIVVNTDGNGKASVKLSTGGAPYHALSITGGPVSIGQQVQVDFTTTIPTIIAPSIAYDYKEVKSRHKPIFRTIESVGTGEIRVFPGPPPASYVFSGTPTSSYPATEVGLNAAIANAVTNDCICIPECNINLTSTLFIPTSGSGVPAFAKNNLYIIGMGKETTSITGYIKAGTSSLNCYYDLDFAKPWILPPSYSYNNPVYTYVYITVFMKTRDRWNVEWHSPKLSAEGGSLYIGPAIDEPTHILSDISGIYHCHYDSDFEEAFTAQLLTPPFSGYSNIDGIAYDSYTPAGINYFMYPYGSTIENLGNGRYRIPIRFTGAYFPVPIIGIRITPTRDVPNIPLNWSVSYWGHPWEGINYWPIESETSHWLYGTGNTRTDGLTSGDFSYKRVYPGTIHWSNQYLAYWANKTNAADKLNHWFYARVGGEGRMVGNSWVISSPRIAAGDRFSYDPGLPDSYKQTIPVSEWVLTHTSGDDSDHFRISDSMSISFNTGVWGYSVSGYPGFEIDLKYDYQLLPKRCFRLISVDGTINKLGKLSFINLSIVGTIDCLMDTYLYGCEINGTLSLDNQCRVDIDQCSIISLADGCIGKLHYDQPLLDDPIAAVTMFVIRNTRFNCVGYDIFTGPNCITYLIDCVGVNNVFGNIQYSLLPIANNTVRDHLRTLIET